MAISSKSITTRYHIRSISLPSESHPGMVRFEQELNNLKAEVASPFYHVLSRRRSICESLNRLIGLYKCMDNLLGLPLIQQVISQSNDEKRVFDGLLDGSVRVLDTCGLMRDTVSHVKEHLRYLQCALRRRKGDSSIESVVSNHVCFRRKVRKDIKRVIANLKQVNRITILGHDHDLNHQFIMVIRVLAEMSKLTIKIFESIFWLFSASVVSSPKPKPSRWSIVSKLTHNRSTTTFANCEQDLQGDMNTLVALINLSKSNSSNEGLKMIHIAQNRLEVMEAQIESMDIGLESLFRCLVRTRALLLNIVSH